MARTLIIGDESAVPSTAGAASSFAQATVLRVINVSGSSATVGVATVVGQIGRFITIPTGTVEFIEKKPNDVVYGTGTSRAAKVGYTG